MADKNISYQKKIVKQLYFGSLLSCLEISLLVNKSIPLTTKILNDLIEKGIVAETGFAQSTGGRRPLMYSLRPEVLYVVAVAMDQFITLIAIMDLHNKIVMEERIELPLSKNDALHTLAHHIRRVVERSGIDHRKFAGVGIGMPGFIDIKKGINYSHLDNDSKSIAHYISGIVQLPVLIDNDSTLIALAELRFGAARSTKNTLIINISWGIGMGLVLNGELYRGNNGFAGEFSHTPLSVTKSDLCVCGKVGCLETEASLLVMINKARRGLAAGRPSLLKDIDETTPLEQALQSIINAAKHGDKFSIELLSESGYAIGRGIAALIHILNPEMIVIGGRGSAAGKIWQAPIQQALHEYCIPRLVSDTDIEISKLGYEAELIGAAALVMENYDKLNGKKEVTATAEETGDTG
jgi:predicted NBD/HSP70 family sugar kinase